jgi:hypothetical protein
VLADPLAALPAAPGTAVGRAGKRKPRRRWAFRVANVGLLATAFLGVVLLAVTLLPDVLGRNDARKMYTYNAAQNAYVVSADFPRNHLSVPNRSGFAPIDKEGVDAQGYLGIPQDVHRVGVYTGAGQLDGNVGDVVIVGHVNWVGQGAGYLGDIGDLKKGAIVVTRGSGPPRAWRVTAVASYLKTAGLPQQIFRAHGPRALTLVTCGGVLDEQQHSYLSNIVVTAEPVRTIVR